MIPISAKQIIKALAMLLLLIAIICAGFLGFVYFGFQLRDYQLRHIECSPQGLVSNIEKVFDVNLPDDIKEVKAAKSKPVEGRIFFIIKFITEPSEIDRFIKSFQKERLKIELEPYNAESDLRHLAGFWRPPRWFRKPIEQGKKYRYRPSHASMNIYIDTADERNFVVYIEGSYSKSYAERKQ